MWFLLIQLLRIAFGDVPSNRVRFLFFIKIPSSITTPFAQVASFVTGETFEPGNGIALGSYIFIDFDELNQTEAVGLIAHELMHAQKGFLNTLFSEDEHDKIYQRHSQILNEYSKRDLVPGAGK